LAEGSGGRTNGRSTSRRFLPPDPRVAEPYRMTPKLALRIGVLGMLALAVFGVLFLRLWALQVLSGEQYLQAAKNNQLRSVRVQAPRGPILDRNGRILVTNRPGVAIQIWPADLPDTWPERRAELRRLARVLGVPVRRILEAINRRRGDPLTPVAVKESARTDEIFYLAEHQAEFPGVEIRSTYLRQYPFGRLAAQLLGHVSEISPEQLKARRNRGYRAGDKVGQSGIEAAYDASLRGHPGQARMRVDSLGHPRSDLIPSAQPRAGYSLRLTLDIRIQRAAERAIEQGIALAQEEGEWAANGGAIVALDPRDGSILALASNPTYHPGVYVGRVNPRALRPLVDERVAKEANYPALNRALEGVYPPGSTFKPVTALAAMQEHLVTPYSTLPCTGSYLAYKQYFDNWDPYVNEAMTLPTALERSCDTYFYELGNQFYSLPPERGHPLQAWSSRFGFGQRTGIDFGPESSGLLPTPEWRKAHFTTELDRSWKPGFSIQLAIGQGDLLVTPLQMARFYALIANGGRLVTPHLAEAVEQAGDGRAPAVVLRRFAPRAALRTGVDPAALAVVREGLYLATHAPYGTSTPVFSSFPVPIAGKTGTAEKIVELPGYVGLRDQSWWCGYGPGGVTDTPEIVVCAVIENGGHGGTAAAPAALKVFEAYFGKESGGQIGPIYSD
jgi:penicillin-binding protein 2